jgi:hypothetical protein
MPGGSAGYWRDQADALVNRELVRLVIELFLIACCS